MAHENPAAGAGMSSHITEDVLDRYATNRLPEPEQARVEEHLLVCPLCQDRLSAVDRFLADLRSALGPPP